jgi:hypothetical protein
MHQLITFVLVFLLAWGFVVAAEGDEVHKAVQHEEHFNCEWRFSGANHSS